MSDHPEVRRVDDEGGSHIEPALDAEWSPLEKLRWHAAVVMLDEGIEFRVVPMSDGTFAVTSSHVGTSGRDFRSAWTYLNGMAHGATLARETSDEVER